MAELWKKTRREFVARFDGVSMRPTIEPLQPITVMCGQEPRVGDVVMFVRGGAPYVHRLIWQSAAGDWLLTRGDNRGVPDPPIGRDDVTGVVAGLPSHAPRGMQRMAFIPVRLAALLGRRAAHGAVRLLQLVSHLRHFRGGRMEGNVIDPEQ